MARQREILVSLAYDQGMAGIVRDDEGTWLTGNLDGHGGTGIGDRGDGPPAREGIAGGGVAVGGLLPSGAQQAIVVNSHGEALRAACAQGAWIAVARDVDLFVDLPVRYEAAPGVIVRPPLPARWKREPVPDAGEPCPACGGGEWERVTPTDESRGTRGRDDGGWEPSPVVVCIRCGHEESEGVWVGWEGNGDDLDGAMSAEAERALQEHRRDLLEALRGLELPVYALDDPDDHPHLGGWGGDGRAVSSVTVQHGPQDAPTLTIEIEPVACAFDSPPVVARRALASALFADFEWPDLSQPALKLWLMGRARERDAQAAGADRLAMEVPIEDRTVPFLGFQAEGAWAAVATVGEVQITMSGRGLAPADLRLRRVTDPLTELSA